MAHYAISGVWKDISGTITDFAIHLVTEITSPLPHLGFVQKYSKAQAIALLSNPLNSAQTVVWDYSNAMWLLGANVQVIGNGTIRYLRTAADETVKDNLDNLINYGWIANNFS